MNLLDKINSKSARIGVLGLGYVGLPLVIEFCRAGFNVTGFDRDAEKVSMLRQGKSYIRHIDPAMIAEILGIWEHDPRGLNNGIFQSDGYFIQFFRISHYDFGR